MSILQHYYTSYKHEATGRSGWQTKATSRGMTPELDETIQGLIGYKYPQSMPSADIAGHPVALRYMYEASKRSFLLCSQSTGVDNQNRPGNFFAHTLVISPEDFSAFTHFPPILCWQSPMWCREDQSQRSELPVLEIHELVEGLDIQQVWEFLAQGQRREELYQLFCALIHRKRTSQRLIILDTNEHIAWWIAALSILLPSDYYPFLSFATYHHAPQQQRYLITGTTSDWWQRVSGSVDPQAFFVLDAQHGDQNTAVAHSLYAQLVTSIASYTEFKQQLLPLFQRYARRFPPQGEIDEQLELFALYVHLLRRRDVAQLNDGEFLAVNSALDSFQQEEEHDREELTRLQDVLSNAPDQQDVRIVNTLERVQALLAQHTR